ncbi:rab-GTPase-TBC domain-containing protein [Fimicolochytrium jonesii]|uniref:rab-GTPase-TBC domain-containing protein n=1 Tax=Fimicolochytrium jonesii TaxID=1396493 RepID=UPI0022FDE7E1|nr:rab-GTPase-TBC domain-containing protein [Fimicolochytrium jonesii]KAI8816875.1 rab-GTPase-TBC domain-containing protein [Fimicolochytrium jonesii]
MSTFKERLALFERLVGPETPADYDGEAFRQLCFRGIPDTPHIRPQAWKLLLHYLPFDSTDRKTKWPQTLREQRATYYAFVKELIRNPSEEELEMVKRGGGGSGCGDGAPGAADVDHPLNDASGSKWQTYYEELNILEQIDKDVRRTLPDLAFFQLPVPESKYSPLHNNPSTTKSAEDKGDSNTGDSTGDAPPAKKPPPPDIKPFSPIQSRRALFKRLEHMNGTDHQFGARTRASPSPQPSQDQTPTQTPLLSALTKRPSTISIPDRTPESGDLHWEAIERILFIYAKLNPGIGYVQGMNEILGPLYYVMANDTDEESRAHAEADSFFAFTVLMAEFRDHFIRYLDNVGGPATNPTANEKQQNQVSRSSLTSMPSDLSMNSGGMMSTPLSRKNSLGELAMEQISGNGIGNSMTRLMKRLKKRDLELWKDFQLKGIHPAYFAFRWLTCLLTQEFPLPDVIQLWDSILADLALDINAASSPSAAAGGSSAGEQMVEGREGRFEFLIDVCCAMIICIRTELLAGSFSDNIALLQNYPISDPSLILQTAFSFRDSGLTTSNSALNNSASTPSTQQQQRARFSPGTHFTKILHRIDTPHPKADRQDPPHLLWGHILARVSATTKPEPMWARLGQTPAQKGSALDLSDIGSPLKAGLSSPRTPNISVGGGGRYTTTATPTATASQQPQQRASILTTMQQSQASAALTNMSGQLKTGFSGLLSRVKLAGAGALGGASQADLGTATGDGGGNDVLFAAEDDETVVGEVKGEERKVGGGLKGIWGRVGLGGGGAGRNVELLKGVSGQPAADGFRPKDGAETTGVGEVTVAAGEVVVPADAGDEARKTAGSMVAV